MTHPNVIPTGAALTLLLSDADTAGALTLFRLTLPPFGQGDPPHVHATHAEGLYVLSGILALTRGEETMVLSSGAAVVINPGVAHACWNPSASPVTALLISTPGAHAAEIHPRAGVPADELSVVQATTHSGIVNR